MWLSTSFRSSARRQLLQLSPCSRFSFERLSLKEECTRTFSATTTQNSNSITTEPKKSSVSTNGPRKLTKPEFYVPIKDRNERRGLFELDVYALGEMRLARNNRQCPTRELYFLHRQWGRHKSPYRKFRHIATLFVSAPFQRLLFPDLFCVSSVAACLTYYNEVIVPEVLAASGSNSFLPTVLSMNPTAFAGATTAIGLLAGFRLNASYGRYREGRQVWSDTQTTLRDLARQIVMWIPDNNNAQVAAHKTRLLRLCEAFSITFLFHLNDKGCHYNMKRKTILGEEQFYNRVQAEFEAELYDVYRDSNENAVSSDNDSETTIQIDNDLLLADFERICRIKSQRGNVPLEVLTCMGETVAALGANNVETTANYEENGILHPFYIRELDEKIQRLCKCLGSGERLLKTPMPTGFTRHSSRLLFIWSNCLPFALYPLLGPIGTLPTSLLTSYAVLGIEDISVQLEEPFDILPLRQFSNTMHDSIQAIASGYIPHVIAKTDEKI